MIKLEDMTKLTSGIKTEIKTDKGTMDMSGSPVPSYALTIVYENPIIMLEEGEVCLSLEKWEPLSKKLYKQF